MFLGKHLSYAKYLFKHKWYTFLACCELGVPCLGIIHDWDKFLPSEWFPYAESHSQGGIYKDMRSNSVKPFDHAWNRHQKKNKHHPEYWILVRRFGNKPLPMPDRYRREMLADWIGASRANNGGENKIKVWYAENGDTLELHLETRNWVESRLTMFAARELKEGSRENG